MRYDPPITLAEAGTFALASAHNALPNPKWGGMRASTITWIDTWYPQTEDLLKKLRAAGDRGVLLFDEERAMGLYD